MCGTINDGSEPPSYAGMEALGVLGGPGPPNFLIFFYIYINFNYIFICEFVVLSCVIGRSKQTLFYFMLKYCEVVN